MNRTVAHCCCIHPGIQVMGTAGLLGIACLCVSGWQTAWRPHRCNLLLVARSITQKLPWFTSCCLSCGAGSWCYGLHYCQDDMTMLLSCGTSWPSKPSPSFCTSRCSNSISLKLIMIVWLTHFQTSRHLMDLKFIMELDHRFTNSNFFMVGRLKYLHVSHY